MNQPLTPRTNRPRPASNRALQAIGKLTLATLPLLLAACATSQPSAVSTLDLYKQRPLAGYQVVVANPQTSKVLDGDSVLMPKADGTGPASAVDAQRSAKDGTGDALTLHWNDVWYASLRLEGGAPLDLRSYVPAGVLALDLKVDDLADGGLTFKINCGNNCERKLPYLVAGRAIAGKGWQHLAIPMSCFYREGDDFSAVKQPFSLDTTGKGRISVANISLASVGTANTTCIDYRVASVTPDMLNESWSVSWWLPRHLQKLADAKAMVARGASPEVVFIGDSITEGWEKSGASVFASNYARYNALALGFGGDRTENVLWRLQHGEVDGLHPKVTVLMIGTNNTGARQEDPRFTAAGIRRDIEELQRRLPDTRILLLAIFPRDATPQGEARKLNAEINAIIAGFADQRVTYLDINQAFLDAKGNLSPDIMPDLLHPNTRGYQIWADAMAPTLTRLLSQP